MECMRGFLSAFLRRVVCAALIGAPIAFSPMTGQSQVVGEPSASVDKPATGDASASERVERILGRLDEIDDQLDGVTVRSEEQRARVARARGVVKQMATAVAARTALVGSIQRAQEACRAIGDIKDEKVRNGSALASYWTQRYEECLAANAGGSATLDDVERVLTTLEPQIADLEEFLRDSAVVSDGLSAEFDQLSKERSAIIETLPLPECADAAMGTILAELEDRGIEFTGCPE